MRKLNTRQSTRFGPLPQKYSLSIYLVTLTVLTIFNACCHKDGRQPDCGCEAAITENHYTDIGHLTPVKDNRGQKTWIIEQNHAPGNKVTISICNLQDPVVKKVIDESPQDTVRVRFAGRLHEQCPPDGMQIPEYMHATMTVDTLTPIIMQPM